jgi:phosphatidylglycerol---prolipoprotein diacylglyceryl transferase
MNAQAKPAFTSSRAGPYLRRIDRFPIRTYKSMVYLGCVIGTIAGAEVAAAEQLSPVRFVLATTALLGAAFVGARLWFVVQFAEAFRPNLRRIWRRSDGGAALYGGLVGALVASVPVLALAGLPFWAFWDAASIGMLLGLIIGRMGCLMHGCCAGRPTMGPLGIWLPNHKREWRRRFPTPILESTWGTLVLALALLARPSLESPGALFAVIAGGYATGRLILEPTREASDPRRTMGVNIAFSAALLVAALIFLSWAWLS